MQAYVENLHEGRDSRKEKEIGESHPKGWVVLYIEKIGVAPLYIGVQGHQLGKREVGSYPLAASPRGNPRLPHQSRTDLGKP
jgi:hypothetical protein